MGWELFVSKRYLFAKQKERFISVTSLISILGIAVGVAALIVVIGVMSGFDEELQSKIMGMNAHVIVMSDTPPDKIPDARVMAKANFVSGQAIINSDKQTQGVLIKGIDSEAEGKVTQINEYLQTGSLPDKNNSVLIGTELAKSFMVGVGDTIAFLSLSSKRPVEFEICGIFASGMYEYDANLVFTNIWTAQNILGKGAAITGVGLKIEEPLKADKVKKDIQRSLGYPYWVRSWMDMNKNLFSALKLEKITMFIILALIVLVASFNIASTLIMMVIEKTKDIGILKSIGASSFGIMKVFVLEGLLIGSIGTCIGSVLGLWLGDLLGKYPVIEMLGLEEIYYFNRLPVNIQPMDLVSVIGMALGISFLATLYPSWKAARLSPVEAIRYE